MTFEHTYAAYLYNLSTKIYAESDDDDKDEDDDEIDREEEEEDDEVLIMKQNLKFKI
jgi:hypothetical protein